MSLEDIIIKSRTLLNKIHYNNKVNFTKEDYFMLSVSVLVAKKESLIKKNNDNNTQYFDYEKYKTEYERMSFVFGTLFFHTNEIKVNIPSLGEYDLTQKNCFDGIEDLRFPFLQKIEVLNFNGSLNELNEIKKNIWIYSKLRDSFVHGDSFRFDIDENVIIIENSTSHEKLGSFEFNIKLTPETLMYLCGNIIETTPYYIGNMDEQTYNKYKNIKDELSDNMSDDLYKILFDEVDRIDNTEELYSIVEMLKMYRKVYSRMTESQKKEYFEKIVRIIFVYSSRNQINSKNSQKLLSVLSDILDSNTNLYLLAMYSHMIFVFSNIKEVNTDNLKTKNIKVKNDPYDRIIKKHIESFNDTIQNFMNPYIEDKEKVRDIAVNKLNEIMNLLKQRNKWIINSIRNGIEHKNIDIDDETIIIFDRVDNNKEEKSFECEVNFYDMDILLLDIENHEKISELNVNEFYDEIISICSDGLNIVKFIMSIEALSKYIENKNAQL